MPTNWEDDYDIPDEIDMKSGNWVRSPFLQDFRELNLVSIDEDLKKLFPNSVAVNHALREFMALREQGQHTSATREPEAA